MKVLVSFEGAKGILIIQPENPQEKAVLALFRSCGVIEPFSGPTADNIHFRTVAKEEEEKKNKRDLTMETILESR